MAPPNHSPAVTRFLRRLAITVLVYLIAVFLTFHVFWHGRLSLPAAVGFATIPSVPLIAMIAVVGLYLKEEKDDFERELFIQSLLWGTGVTLAFASFWSFLHLFAHVHELDGFHMLLLFWVVVGLSTIPLRRYYGGGSSE